MNLIEKIDMEIIEARHGKQYDLNAVEYRVGVVKGLEIAKKYIISEQKEPQIIINLPSLSDEDINDCKDKLKELYEFTDKMQGGGTDINVTTKTIGDKIRESNESLAEYLTATAYSCEQCIFKCYDEDLNVKCAWGRKTTCEDGITQYLNQPYAE